MQRNQFLNLVEDPQRIPAVTAAALKELVQQFPYCQTLQLLFVKQLHDTNHFSFNQQLKVASIYAGNRIVLFELINKQQGPVESVSDNISENTTFNLVQESNDSEPVSNEKLTEEVTLFDVAPVITLADDTPDEATFIIGSAIATESENLAALPVEIDENPNESEKVDLQSLINQRINELLNQNSSYGSIEINLEQAESNFQNTDADSELQSTLGAENSEIINVDTHLIRSDDLLIKETEVLISQNENIDITDEKKETVLTSDVAEKDEDIEPHSFLFWLNQSKANHGIAENISPVSSNTIENKLQQEVELTPSSNIHKEEKEIKPPKNEPLASDKKASLTDLNSSTKDVDFEIITNHQETINLDDISEKKHSDSANLIDQFIQNQPRIETKKHAFYSPVNAARASVVFDSEVVSETLAEIFVKQQLYQKAIIAYEKLSLKFPEKSISFPTRIEKIKEEAQKK